MALYFVVVFLAIVYDLREVFGIYVGESCCCLGVLFFLMFSTALYCAIIYTIYEAFWAMHVDTNITIDWTKFSIKRTFHSEKNCRDSCTNPEEYATKPTCWERFWLFQTNGNTSELTKQKLLFSCKLRSVVLFRRSEKTKIQMQEIRSVAREEETFTFSTTNEKEIEWMVLEINRVLKNIRSGHGNV